MWITHSKPHKYCKNSVDNYVDNFMTYKHSITTMWITFIQKCG